MVNFYIPDFFFFKDINLSLIQLMRNHPEYFYENIQIGAVYGSFPNMVWNGGRVVVGKQISLNEIQTNIDVFNNLKIPIRFTCTNSLIAEEHCLDYYCNSILEYANQNSINEVLVNSLVLENYLRTKYSNLKNISSTTKCNRNADFYNKEQNNYDLMVIDFRDNKNKEFLNELKYKEKIELLINAECSPYCFQREQHYQIMDMATLNYNGQKNFSCPHVDTFHNFYDLMELNKVSFISEEELYHDYIDLGFSHFKIEGRIRSPLYAIESYVYYLVKPQYKDKVRYSLLSTII